MINFSCVAITGQVTFHRSKCMTRAMRHLRLLLIVFASFVLISRMYRLEFKCADNLN